MTPIDRQALEAAKRASVAQLLFKAARLVNERALERVAELNPNGPALRPAHTNLLPHITFEGVRLTMLAQKLGVSKQAVSQLVADMVELGVVEYAVDPSDARAKLVRFTPKGAEGIAQGLSVLREIESGLEAKVGAQAMSALRCGLEAVLEVLEC